MYSCFYSQNGIIELPIANLEERRPKAPLAHCADHSQKSFDQARVLSRVTVFQILARNRHKCSGQEKGRQVRDSFDRLGATKDNMPAQVHQPEMNIHPTGSSTKEKAPRNYGMGPNDVEACHASPNTLTQPDVVGSLPLDDKSPRRSVKFADAHLTTKEDNYTFQTQAIHSTSGTTVDDSSSSFSGEEELSLEVDLDITYSLDYARPLGTGTNTVVRRAMERKTGKHYAVKSVCKSNVKEFNAMKAEAKLMSRLDHPKILQIHDQYHDDKSYHIALEICKGGEAYDLVTAAAKQNKTVREDVASRIVQQVVQAVQYCHSRNIVHRDIKLENVLLKKGTKDDAMEVRLADFGMATKHCRGDAPLTDYVG